MIELTLVVELEARIAGINGYRNWSNSGNSFLQSFLTSSTNIHITFIISSYTARVKLAIIILRKKNF